MKPFIPPLLLLPPQLIPEGIATASNRVLVLERGRDGAVHQAAEVTITARATAGLGDGVVRVLVQGRALGLIVLETDGTGADTRLVPPVEEAAGLAAGVAVAVPAHDVAELDAACLAVPEEDSEDEEEDGADGDGQGDGEVARVDVAGLVLGRAVGVEDEGNGVGCLADDLAAVVVDQQGEGDVVRARALEVGGLDFERVEAPVGGDGLGFVELGEADVFEVVCVGVVGGFLLGSAVEVVEADGDG
jgi:hypothetical protein